MAGKPKETPPSPPGSSTEFLVPALAWIEPLGRYVHAGELVDMRQAPQGEIDALLTAGVLVVIVDDAASAEVTILADLQPVSEGRSSTGLTLQKE